MVRDPRVAVVGGGIGGLAAAVALRARGIDVNVFEQAPALGEVGAGVQLAPNGLRQLDRLGVGAQIRENLTRFDRDSCYRRSDGTSVTDVLVSDSAGQYPVGGIHRADLLDALHAALPRHVLHTGMRVDAVAPGRGGAEIRFADGTVLEADAVIGADGIHSCVRAAVTTPSKPRFSGMVAYRGLVDRDRVPEWPESRFEIWMGEGRHFLTFPVRQGAQINFVGFVPADKAMQESWSAPGDQEQLAAEFAGWDARVVNLISHVEVTNRWGLYDRDPLEEWTAPSVTLLGDAAHPMLPHLGQGANQAIEDAAALAAILTTSSSVNEGLKRYSSVRRGRTADVQQGSRQSGRRYDSNFLDLDERDQELKASIELRRWIYDFDVLEHLDEYTPANNLTESRQGEA